MKRALEILSIVCAALSFGACSSSESGARPREVARFRELLVLDASVVADARASNRANGAWSFRHAAEQLGASPDRGGAIVLAWLRAWSGDDAARAERIRNIVTCPWLRRTPANACDASCDVCAREELDLAEAPFRFIAIANRMDLGVKPDAISDAGEGRLLFAITDGAADDPSSSPLRATVVFEYALGADRTATEWASDWHALGALGDFDEEYKRALAQLTERFVARAHAPTSGASTAGASSLSQIRTNDDAFGPPHELREFALDASATSLVARGLRNTPDASLDGTDALRAFVESHEAKVRADAWVLPPELRANAIDAAARWSLSGIEESTRKAFAQGTCNGCHASEVKSKDDGFHVSPLRIGLAAVSPFLNDPADPANDELHRRETFMQSLLQ